MNPSEIMETLHNAAASAAKVKGKRKEKELSPTKESMSSAPRIITRYPVEPISAVVPVPVSPSVGIPVSAPVPSPLPVQVPATRTPKPVTPIHVPSSPLIERPTVVKTAAPALVEESVIVVRRKSERSVKEPNAKTISAVVPVPPTPVLSPPVIEQPTVAAAAPPALVIAVRRKSERNMKEPNAEPIPAVVNETLPVHTASLDKVTTPSERPRNVTGRKRRHTDLEKHPSTLTDIVDNAERNPSDAHKNGTAPCFTGTPEESISTALKRRSERFNVPAMMNFSPMTPKVKVRNYHFKFP